MKIYITVLFGLLLSQSLFSQSTLTQKQIEKENYREVLGFSEFQNDTLKPDVFPMYPNGQEGLVKDVSKNIKYPPSARKQGIQGKVLVTFIVEKDGTIEKIEIIKSADPTLDEEAIRLIGKLKPWVPGIKNDQAVAVPFIYPINFQLE